jgi:anthranilate/para-aminobenzoate synthase component II
MKVVIVDCFDSFTYNLYQLVGSLGAQPYLSHAITQLRLSKRLNLTGLFSLQGRAHRMNPEYAEL